MGVDGERWGTWLLTVLPLWAGCMSRDDGHPRRGHHGEVIVVTAMGDGRQIGIADMLTRAQMISLLRLGLARWRVARDTRWS
jgi:hypothetical protein